MQHRRSGFSSGLVLIAVLVLVGCTPRLAAPRSTATLSPAEQAPAVEAMTATPTVTAEPTATSRPTITPTATPLPTPTLIPDLQGLPVHPAPGSLVRQVIPAGQEIGQRGAYFMKVSTGEIEGWTLAGTPDDNLTHFTISGDGRWIQVRNARASFLADRVTGRMCNWDGASRVWLLAAGGDHLLFAGDQQVWLVRGDLRSAIVLPLAAIWPGARMSPDGQRAMLLSGNALYLLDTQTGALRVLSPDELPDGREVQSRWLDMSSQGEGVVVWSRVIAAEGATTRTQDVLQRFSWQGDPIDPSPVDVGWVSPDGSLVAWEDDLGALAPAVVVADAATLKPRFRVKGAMLCTPILGSLGTRWLADSSGLVLRTFAGYRVSIPENPRSLAQTDGYRIVDRDGHLRAAPGQADDSLPFGIVPAPDRADLFAVDGHMVVDDKGALVAEARLSKQSILSLGRVDPWGAGSVELRFVVSPWAKEGMCSWLWPVPLQVERAPFPSEVALVVGLPADDCLNLRVWPDVSARVITCVPGGNRVVIAPSSEPIPDGISVTISAPAATWQYGQWWVRVRTANGQEGWVDGTAGKLAWAP